MTKPKFLLKLLSFLLAGLMFAAVPAAALEKGDTENEKVSKNEFTNVSISANNPIDNYSDYISYNVEIYEKYTDACNAIQQGLKNMEKRIDLIQYHIPVKDFKQVFYAARYRLPDLFYIVQNGCPYAYNSASQIVFILPVYDSVTKEQVATMQDEFYAKADWYLSKVDDSMNDFQKALVLHDALALECYYDYNTSVYNLIINGFGQCVTYTWMYSYLLAQVGIKSEIIESDSMDHTWNKVCIDGEYYNVDLTWDDPQNDKPGHVSHTYFLLSDEAFSTEYKNGQRVRDKHYDYVSDYASTSTKYDDYDILHEVDSKFCYVDGDLYCIDNKYKSDYERSILKYNESNDSAEILKNISTRWSAGDHLYWGGGFMSLDEYEGILYYNTDNTINYYDVKNDTFEEYQTQLDMNNSCFGLMIKGTSLYAVIADTPNVTGTLEYVGECIIPKNQLTTQPEPEPQRVRGDVDGDGELTITDATVIQRYLAKFYEFTETQKLLADFDRDGEVTICDVTYIQRTLVGLYVPID